VAEKQRIPHNSGIRELTMKLLLSDDYFLELKEWIRHSISEAEKKGDVAKRKQFLALKAELP
jgi:hypothetical protein